MNKLSIVAALSVGLLTLGGVYAENQTGAVASNTTGANTTGVVAPLTGDKAPLTGDEAPLTGDKAPLTGDKAPLTGDKAPKNEDDGVAIGGHKIFMSKPVGSLRPFNHVGKDLPVSFNIMKKETLFSGTTTAYGSIDSFSGNFKVSLEMSNNLVEPKTWKALDPKDYHLTGIISMYSGTIYQLSGLRVKEPGFYRITIQQEDGEKLSGTQEIKVFTYQSEYAFTGDELAKVKAVSQIWDNLVDTLKKQSPKLSGDQNWIKASDEVKSNIDAILAYEENEKVATKENRPHYYSAPTDWRSFSYLNGAWMADTTHLTKSLQKAEKVLVLTRRKKVLIVRTFFVFLGYFSLQMSLISLH